MFNNPSIYEINTRIFLKRFSSLTATLRDIPNEYWNYFEQKKFDYIWLMGIWKTCDSVIEKYCFEDNLVRSYDAALKDWCRNDVIGSPFSIDVYEINPSIGNLEMLLDLKKLLNKKNIGLILDFIPNHFSAHSRLIKENPSLFLNVDKETYEKDPHTFYKPLNLPATSSNEEKYFAHGRDPFFPAWQDTIQVNLLSKEAREYFTNVLIELTKVCDGVRCDMAMLALNNVFKNTWAGVIEKINFNTPQEEFWKEIIPKIKKERKDFIFIAEAYWDLERELLQLGFDFAYDKKLTDQLKFGTSQDIYDHLLAVDNYQKKLVRFLENHDEDRAIIAFGKEKSKVAAIIISTIPGMHFYFDGQFEGKKIRLPIQLGREPEEQPQNDLIEFYDKLLTITSDEVFKKGNWKLLQPLPSWHNNNSYLNMLAWQWEFNSQKRLVVVNYSSITSTCRLKLDVSQYPESFEIKDLLNDQTYIRSSEEVYHIGLYIELKPYQSHIFSY